MFALHKYSIITIVIIWTVTACSVSTLVSWTVVVCECLGIAEECVAELGGELREAVGSQRLL